MPVRLLVMGLGSETRRRHKQSLVDSYFERLLEHGVRGLSKGRLWFQIRAMNIWNLHMNVMAAVNTDLSVLEGQAGRLNLDWRDALFDRLDAAMQDWDTGDTLVHWLAEARHR